MKKNPRLTLLLVAIILLVKLAGAQEVPVWKLADLQTAIYTAKAPTILNFWATFCKPCIAEMPHFEEMASRYRAKGLKLLFVSLDLRESYPAEIVRFKTARKLKAPVVYLDEANADRFVPLVDTAWSGAIPATLFLNQATGYRLFVEAELSRIELEGEIRKMLAATDK